MPPSPGLPRALFGNSKLAGLAAAAGLAPADARSWPACAVRALFRPGPALAAAACGAMAGRSAPLVALHVRSEGKMVRPPPV